MPHIGSSSSKKLGMRTCRRFKCENEYGEHTINGVKICDRCITQLYDAVATWPPMTQKQFNSMLQQFMESPAPEDDKDISPLEYLETLIAKKVKK